MDGDPPPHFEWHVDGAKMSENTSKLYVPQVDRNTTYSCTATNDLGNATMIFHVQAEEEAPPNHGKQRGLDHLLDAVAKWCAVVHEWKLWLSWFACELQIASSRWRPLKVWWGLEIHLLSTAAHLTEMLTEWAGRPPLTGQVLFQILFLQHGGLRKWKAGL